MIPRSLFTRIFEHSVLRDDPPMLLDLGASGFIHPSWKPIAGWSICLTYEPDARDKGWMEPASRGFRKLVVRDLAAVSEHPDDGEAPLYLTREPHCSSTLEPDKKGLDPWLFSRRFHVENIAHVRAVNLGEDLSTLKLERVDWYKADTQGTDLRLFNSLPERIRANILSVEMEPGILPAYVSEDRLESVLASLRQQGFWPAEIKIQNTPRAPKDSPCPRILERFGTGAAGWANVAFLREPERLGRDLRSYLLLWVIATLHRQDGFALEVAGNGLHQFNEPLLSRLALASRRRLAFHVILSSLRWPKVFLRRMTSWF